MAEADASLRSAQADAALRAAQAGFGPFGPSHGACRALLENAHVVRCASGCMRFEQFPVYQQAVRAAATAHACSSKWHARPDLRDQLRRASASIVLNIAEGSGEHSAKEKVRFYRIAKRSALEAIAVLGLANAIGLPLPGAERLRQDFADIATALLRLIRAREED